MNRGTRGCRVFDGQCWPSQAFSGDRRSLTHAMWAPSRDLHRARRL
eukprot:CAMPEP_0183444510 /NCGR_PEP_ID=MMETSP0370-20130417/95301_1 /TAXON_ID=268820 /ORGANISM="Peridinium aciculiferum, Strain PAER-2" /LENGTH=45 /DNA_ID= /DNA_START= /DNA_END= /DNA_ORIENTATION=